MQRSLAAEPHPDDLTEACRAFERWRRSRPRGERIPDALWRQAVELAQAHGVSRVSQALRLDYYALQRRADAGPEAVRVAQPSFIELSLPGPSEGSRCQIELADDRGAMMRVELAGMSPRDLAAVVRCLARPEP